MKRLILQALSSAEGPVSGEALSRAVGKSRTAIWQWIKELREDGYVIDAAPNRGYRLLSRPDRLYPWEIQSRLKTWVIGREIEYRPVVDSTNDLAKTMAKDGAAEGLVVVAEEQRKGKGRRGRSWASPFGLGVWVSVLLRPAIAPYDAPQAALVAALAAARAVEGEVGVEAQIKWPNDILVGGLKTAGILVEMDAELEEVRSLVIGVGINVNLSRQELPEDARSRATSLMEAAGRKIDRVELLAAFLTRLEESYFTWIEKGFAAILPALREKAAYLGERVEVIEAGRRWQGIARDLGDDGALLVEDDSGQLVAVYAAEVSLRPGQGARSGQGRAGA